MEISGLLPRRMAPVAVVFACAIGLTGCFDLEQRVAVNSNGGGDYAVVISADGLVGDALKKKHADVDIGDDRAVTHVARVHGKTVQTSEIAFKDLSDLELGDEIIALQVKGKKLLGLGGTEVSFHRVFQIDRVRRHHRHDFDDGDDRDLGRDILTSMFGDHTYTFAVWLPGSIEHVAPVRAGDHVIYPQVWADKYGHTVVWKMKLVDMMMAHTLAFDVDFVAHGNFKDSATIYDRGRHHHHVHDET